MATAQTIVYDALKEIGVLGEDETPSASMADDALRALNRLMELWSNDQAFAYVANTVSRAMTTAPSFTIGPTGDVIADRPIDIETATVDLNGITYPVKVISNIEYDSITYKGAFGSYPTYIYYAGTMPNGTVYTWPLASNCTLNMRVLNIVNSFATLATTLLMPPGYEEALIKNLAVNIAPQYPGVVVSPITINAARNSFKALQRTNNVIPLLSVDGMLLNRHGGNIAAFIGGY